MIAGPEVTRAATRVGITEKITPMTRRANVLRRGLSSETPRHGAPAPLQPSRQLTRENLPDSHARVSAFRAENEQSWIRSAFEDVSTSMVARLYGSG